MRLLRLVLAVVAGYLVMAILVTIASVCVALATGMPLKPPADGTIKLPEPVALWYTVNLAYSFLFAALGGWLATWIAGASAQGAAWSLAGLLVVMSGVSMVLAPAGIPAWWTVGEAVVGVAGVLLGGWLRARRSPQPAPA